MRLQESSIYANGFDNRTTRAIIESHAGSKECSYCSERGIELLASPVYEDKVT